LSRFRIKKELKNFLREEVGIENIYIDPFPDFLGQEEREKEMKREERRTYHFKEANVWWWKVWSVLKHTYTS